MPAWNRRPPLRLLSAVGSGFRIGAAHALRFWPVLFAAELAIGLPARQLLVRVGSGPDRLPLRSSIELFGQLLALLLGAALIAGAAGRAQRRRPLALGASLEAGLIAARTPLAIASAAALLAGLLIWGQMELGAFGGLVTIVGWPALALFLTRAALAAPAAACERLAPGAALVRSANLVRGAGWRLFRLLLLLGLAWWVTRNRVWQPLRREVQRWLGTAESIDGPRFASTLALAAIEAAFDALFWLVPVAAVGALYDQAREREGPTVAELHQTFA